MASALEGIRKRPAAGPGGQEHLMKKPSSWMDEPEEALDPTPITPQQRHVWEKAMALLPGTPGALPQEIRDRHAAATT